ncbi:MAG: hypothetical protein COA96_18035 [SAR86 cluster bacterium]|uniref:CENP-V/GFA domain-containing protein n=1 Tax=SAR86 cluster bacterium TaxID=2030880 RepID=A0A2A5ADI9_9GAMM|nr:MAG: hypothetical protein COA96_18035 [SAR86 cluster bacterium]
MKIHASCSCTKVQFESEIEPVIQLCCHCLDCQDALQADYAEIAFFKISSAKWSGATESKNYVADSGSRTRREQCAECSTVMFDRSEGFPKLIGVMMAQIKPPFSSEPACHVYIKDKQAKVLIPDGIKTYEKGIS